MTKSPEILGLVKFRVIKSVPIDHVVGTNHYTVRVDVEGDALVYRILAVPETVLLT
jgi:hypothetical protein